MISAQQAQVIQEQFTAVYWERTASTGVQDKHLLKSKSFCSYSETDHTFITILICQKIMGGLWHHELIVIHHKHSEGAGRSDG